MKVYVVTRNLADDDSPDRVFSSIEKAYRYLCNKYNNGKPLTNRDDEYPFAEVYSSIEEHEVE